MKINILAVGDVVGNPGMDFLEDRLPALKRMKNIAFTVVNGENANVVGVTPKQAQRILDAGADVVTLGNHTWTRYELKPFLDSSRRVLRPANFAPQCPGRGWGVYNTPVGKICVINLMGRYTLDSNTDNPFVAADCILQDVDTSVVLVDMHAEASSERQAMAWFLDGRVSAVWGTHTHVQTSDAMVLPGGTGLISDVGMTGPMYSILGIEPTQSVNKFLGDPPERYRAAAGPCKMECAVFTVDTDTGRCLEVEALRIT